MFYWLLTHSQWLRDLMEQVSSGDSQVFLTARIAVASFTSFVCALLLGPLAIRWLQSRFRERVASASAQLDEIQSSKNATPTMGGLFIVSAIVIASLVWCQLTNPLVQLTLIAVVSFAVLGAVDDWVKISKNTIGMTAKQKFAAQLVIALGLSYWLTGFHTNHDGFQGILLPLGNAVIPLGAFAILWCSLVTVGTSNAVNLTDGLDGLAGGCLIFAGLTFAGLSYVTGHQVLADYVSIPHIVECGELAIVMGAMVGAVLGFLWFNCHPAQVFMGDTGSLPLGALLAIVALCCRQELLLVVCGGIFVIEALSVIFQVGWYRLTKKRLIACSPLHNHYLFRGEHETKIVVRFWIGSALCSILTLVSLKIR